MNIRLNRLETTRMLLSCLYLRDVTKYIISYLIELGFFNTGIWMEKQDKMTDKFQMVHAQLDDIHCFESTPYQFSALFTMAFPVRL